MNSYFLQPVQFIIETLFFLYILCVMLRFLLGMARADFYNPLSQFLVKVTNPLLMPLRKIIPVIGKVDTAAIVLLLVLQVAMLAIIIALHGIAPPLLTIIPVAIGKLIMLVIYIYTFAIFVMVIISWINPGTYNPVTSILHSLTDPVLGPARRLIPPVGGLDLSPLFALIALTVLRMLVQPLLPALY